MLQDRPVITKKVLTKAQQRKAKKQKMDRTGTLTQAMNASADGMYLESMDKPETNEAANKNKTKPIYERYEEILR